MKLLKLKIRNIASIESGEIDFGHDLCDGAGAPSPLFLISGDTGAGKTVILDCIAMALYKNTPRIGLVKNPTRNSFITGDKEDMKVASIQQYTRLGISPDAECYSELTFEGNDGRIYTTRLSLGMQRKYTRKEDVVKEESAKVGEEEKIQSEGKRKRGSRKPKSPRRLGHREPKWTLTDPDGRVLERTGDIQEVINQAVGLTFEQFGRMAMLAQGQFASFLTGDKSEREQILEQLTNTSRFSDYGTAITNLHSRAKSAYNQAQMEYDALSRLILSSEQRETLSADTLRFDAVTDYLNALSGGVRRRLDIIRSMPKEEVIAGLRESHAAAESTLKEFQATIDARGADAPLFDDIKGVLEKIRSYSATVKAIATAEAALAKSDNDRRPLTDTLQTATDLAKKAKEEYEAAKSEADARLEEYNALNPEENRKALDAARLRLTQLTRAQEIWLNITALHEAIRAGRDRMLTDSENVRRIHRNLQKAEILRADAKNAHDDAQALLSTMKLSVEDTLVNLRQRLAAEHAERCPLCGGEIHALLHEEEFETMLTPLRLRQGECAAAFNDADKALVKLRGEYADAEAGLRAARETVLRHIADCRALRKQRDRLPDFGPTPVTELIDSTQKDIETRTSAEAKAAEMLKAWQEFNKSVQSLLTTADKAEKSRAKAEKALSDFDAGVLRTRATRDNDVKRRDESAVEITASIAYREPHWQEETEAVAERLKTAADGYAADCRRRDEMARALHTEGDRIAKMEADVKQSLADLHAPSTDTLPSAADMQRVLDSLSRQRDGFIQRAGAIRKELETDDANHAGAMRLQRVMEERRRTFEKWDRLNSRFGGTRFRTLVQSYILRPLLHNANVYLRRITDRYMLTCSEQNEQLSILVRDRYNKDQVRSVTVLSGGERFMISLALSLALSSLNRPDLNVDILFIDEGFGTLDEKSLDSVMTTLECLQEIAGQQSRRVGIISHREELDERIPVQIRVSRRGEGRSVLEFPNR